MSGDEVLRNLPLACWLITHVTHDQIEAAIFLITDNFLLVCLIFISIGDIFL